MRIAIYTAIFGDYEIPRDPMFIDEGIDYILFTDQHTISSKWEVRMVEHIGLTKRKEARAIKILSHQFLPEYDLTIWVDANFCQRKSLKPLIEKMQEDMLILNHPSRSCIYTEATAVLDSRREYPEIVDEQMYYYQLQGYPANNGLIASGLIIRNNNEIVNQVNEDWWHEVLSKSGRDQLSFDYVAWINDFKFDKVPFSTLTEYFDAGRHKHANKVYI